MAAIDAERALLRAGFDFLRSKASHPIYGKSNLRVTVPFHGNTILHPKIVKQVVDIIDEDAAAPGAAFSPVKRRCIRE